MKSVPVEDLPEDMAELVARFAEYLRLNKKLIESRSKEGKKKLPKFRVVDLGVKEPLTRKEIYEDV